MDVEVSRRDPMDISGCREAEINQYSEGYAHGTIKVVAYIYSEIWTCNLAAVKQEVLINRLVKEIETEFQQLSLYAFGVQE